MHIGIVGAGMATVALLDALAGSAAKPGAITVFESSSAVWRGRAYQRDQESVRVNAPPMAMTARGGDLDHYLRWLGERPELARFLDEGLGLPVVPRAVYGRYLEHTAETAIANLRQDGWRVSVVNSGVTGFSRDPNATLHTADGGTFPVDRAVLSIGGGQPRDSYGLADMPGYVHEPYPLHGRLVGVAADRHVAVIGSGLTAVDIVTGLVSRGHTGPISLMSRSGVLPAVQQRPIRYEPRYLTPEYALQRVRDNQGQATLTMLIDLMKNELSELGHDFRTLAEEVIGNDTEPPVQRLRRQLSLVADPHQGRRLLGRAIRTVVPAVWPLFREQDKTMLRSAHFRTINCLSSPMVPHNANILLRLLDSGQVRLRPGLQKIQPHSNAGFTVTDNTEWTADVVINAVNPPAYTVPQAAEGLVRSLLTSASAERHPFGGLTTQHGTGRLLISGRPQGIWYAQGNIASTSTFIATDPTGLAHEAARLARALTT
ncbi:FAD/NAD(P)-binding protein [Nocardia pneumoniae]|uniref:FAD/NAD(P)-binding protein n=1 Tax=Nocardia pneumoniae TaxID=228601 RepID=UPI0002DAC206|nr:FAD/NAD(P)-binding protein [Nocardia pneumoniae]